MKKKDKDDHRPQERKWHYHCYQYSQLDGQMEKHIDGQTRKYKDLHLY